MIDLIDCVSRLLSLILVNAICSPFTTLDDAIQKFCEAFGSLANSLDSSLMVQTTVVSLRIDTRVEELSA